MRPPPPTRRVATPAVEPETVTRGRRPPPLAYRRASGYSWAATPGPTSRARVAFWRVAQPAHGPPVSPSQAHQPLVVPGSRRGQFLRSRRDHQHLTPAALRELPQERLDDRRLHRAPVPALHRTPLRRPTPPHLDHRHFGQHRHHTPPRPLPPPQLDPPRGRLPRLVPEIHRSHPGPLADPPRSC